jgi:hypothetical protein
MAETKKAELYLTGPREAAPTVDDLVALFRRLTGKEPTAEEVAAAQAVLERSPDIEGP